MRPAFNQSVSTPLGKGRSCGTTRQDDQTWYIVRLPINEQTQSHLHDENCITPKATHSGLWQFLEGDLQ